MSKKLKLLPAIISLLAGAVTSILTFCFRYEGKTAILIVVAVLLAFYLVGMIVQRTIYSFELKNESEKLKQEGKVVEKEDNKEDNAEQQATENIGNSEEEPKDDLEEDTTQESPK